MAFDCSVKATRALLALPAGRRAMNCLAIMACITVTSCALLKPQEAPRETFDISAPDDVQALRGATPAQILVKVPTSLDALNSQRIIVRPSPRVITYLAGAQWSDTVPRMIQSKLVEAFENTGATGATAKPGDGLVIDYQLIPDLRRFDVTDGIATVEMSVKLLADRTGKVVETRIFTASHPAAGSTGASYVAAFDAAFDEMARDIIRWVVAQT